MKTARKYIKSLSNEMIPSSLPIPLYTAASFLMQPYLYRHSVLWLVCMLCSCTFTVTSVYHTASVHTCIYVCTTMSWTQWLQLSCSSPGAWLSLGGQLHSNNSAIELREIFESPNDAHALMCVTSKRPCWASPSHRFGEWYCPNGSLEVQLHSLPRKQFLQEQREWWNCSSA